MRSHAALSIWVAAMSAVSHHAPCVSASDGAATFPAAPPAPSSFAAAEGARRGSSSVVGGDEERGGWGGAVSATAKACKGIPSAHNGC